MVYQGYRRFLALNDPRRRKSTLNTHYQRWNIPYWTDNERLPAPVEVTYEVYKNRVLLFEEMLLQPGVPASHFEGVKHLWEFGRLSYADIIFTPYDLMHAANNVVKTGLQMIRKHVQSRHPNRTVEHSVLEYERTTNQRFEHVITQDSPWALEEEEENLVDARLQRVKSCDMSSVPRNVYKHMGFRSSHQMITFAATLARFCLSDLGSKEHSKTVLAIFDFIKFSTADHFDLLYLQNKALPALYGAMADWEGMFPVSECTYAFHQFLHCISEIPKCGPPRNYWMFSFERVNKYLIGLLRNQAYPIASIAKNYCLCERAKHLLYLSFNNSRRLAKYYDFIGQTSITTLRQMQYDFRYIHVDQESGASPIIHTTTASRIIDVHGHSRYHLLTALDKVQLLRVCLEFGDEDSLLHCIHGVYKSVVQTRRVTASFFEWVQGFDRIPQQYHAIRNYCREHDSDSDVERIESDWEQMKQGFGRNLLIYQRALMGGNDVVAKWTKIGNDNNEPWVTESLQDIANLKPRQKVPVILSWTSSDSRAPRKLYGIPCYFFRLSFTSAIEDYATVYFRVINNNANTLRDVGNDDPR
jgi:hypothetical protein